MSYFLSQVTVPKDLVALMSAVGTGSNIHPQNPDKKVFTFTQKVIITNNLHCNSYACTSLGKLYYIIN